MSFLFGKMTPRGVQRGMFGIFGPFVGGLLSILISPFLLLIRIFPFAFRLLGIWWGKREFKHLLYGLPTILVATVSLGFVINGRMLSGSEQRALRYRIAAEKAMLAEDWKKAELFYQRAVEMGIRDPATKFELAKAAEGAGDTPVKVAIMESLAPDQQAVFAPAHLWQATRILRQPQLSQEQVQRAVRHLQHVLALSPESPLANGMLGDVYFQMGVYEQSIPYLKRTDYSKPVWRLMLAKACALTGDRAGAQTYGEQAQSLFEKMLVADPTDVQARLDLGEATLLLEKFPNTIKLLEDGLKLNPDPRYKKALTQVLIHWSDSILRDSPDQQQTAFQLLAKALEYDPNEILLFDRIIALLKANDANAKTIEDFLLDNITQGRAVGISHLILGTALYERQELEQGGFHLQRAFELLPQGPIIANNFAWHLVQSDPGDPDRALTIINEVIRQFPTDVEYKDTRGHIEVALSMWDAAITDLETSLAEFPNRPATHAALAKAYAGTGRPEIAERHSLLAERLKIQKQ